MFTLPIYSFFICVSFLAWPKKWWLWTTWLWWKRVTSQCFFKTVTFVSLYKQVRFKPHWCNSKAGELAAFFLNGSALCRQKGLELHLKTNSFTCLNLKLQKHQIREEKIYKYIRQGQAVSTIKIYYWMSF